MQRLDPPDLHHVNAALGWLGLGAPREAREELEKVSDRRREHPEFLEAGWQVCAAEGEWGEALEWSRRMIQAAPALVSGWINRSYCLHELGRTQEALDSLSAVEGRFRDVGTIPYNLACYHCQLGQLEEARRWLARAVALSGRAEVKRLAMADRDLRSLEQEISLW